MARDDEARIGVVDGVVDVEMTTGLDGEVEAYFFAGCVDPCVVAAAFVRLDDGC